MELTANEDMPIDGNSALGMKIPIYTVSPRGFALSLSGEKDSPDQHTITND